MRLKKDLQKFVDQLPINRKAVPIKKGQDGTYYEIDMRQFKQRLHRDLPPTLLWGYDGLFPGPTIVAEQHEQVYVKWINHLPDHHFLPVDQSLHGVHGNPEVRTVVHLHGGETPPDSDGHPDAWFTRHFKVKGPYFERETYHYPNRQKACTLWYHDHAMGLTRLNIQAGLTGFYIIHDKEERSLHLPRDEYDIALMIQDRSFNEDGSLYYPESSDNAPSDAPRPSVQPFFCGDKILVNGKIWPYFEVEPRRYRLRLLNGSNTRAYKLRLENGIRFYQIASDGGLLPAPILLSELSLEPAERAEIIIDFSNHMNEEIILKNDEPCNPESDEQTGDVMQFRVIKNLQGKDSSKIPAMNNYFKPVSKDTVHAVRNLKLTGKTDTFGRPILLLDDKMWSDPVSEKPVVGTTEIWSIINTTNFAHPIHLHLVQFQVLDRRPFDVDLFNQSGEIIYTGGIRAPEPNERGLKDTIRVTAGEITRIIANFAPYTGEYVWHCHILEHEDYEMMRPFIILDQDTKK